MNDMEWVDWLIKLSTLTGAIGFLGNTLIKFYKKYVTDPDQKMAEKIQKEYTESLKATIEPLTENVGQLKMYLEDSQNDRKNIHKRIDAHDSRIFVLEEINGVKRYEVKK